ncbi:MAG: tRNA modification GTPase [Planctomycetota bacterium]|jgi:tRNA modification GTPase
MYDVNDTIVAISSPAQGTRSIVRIAGAESLAACSRIFQGTVSPDSSGVVAGTVAVGKELRIDAQLYLFRSPHSYAGDDIAEIHINANSKIVEALLGDLLGTGLRMAGPGEFTARAYLNGKIDLSQAEAVNEIVSSSNTFQLAAAEKLLSGQLSESAEQIRSAIMDCLSLLEAGLDFSEEDIEFISPTEVVERLAAIRKQLEDLLAGSIGYESVIDLPAVGIAGAPNAGKSSLVNALLGTERSIVSHERKTTRDVLTGILELAESTAVLFDCAGLLHEPRGILDELAQQAAVEAMRNSTVVVLCVDVSKSDWAEDVAVRKWIDAGIVMPVATKSDLLADEALAERIGELEGLFGTDFMPISVVNGSGVEMLREEIDRELAALMQREAMLLSQDAASHVALTARHKRAVTEAIESIGQAAEGYDQGGPEVAAMMLRAAWQSLCAIEQPQCVDVDEQILERIFSSFCIGK